MKGCAQAEVVLLRHMTASNPHVKTAGVGVKRALAVASFWEVVGTMIR